MPETAFRFHSSKSANGDDGGFPSAVERNLKQFQAQVPLAVRVGEAAIQVGVTHPEEHAYFVILFAGPFTNMETLQLAVEGFAREDLVEQMRRIGIE